MAPQAPVRNRTVIGGFLPFVFGVNDDASRHEQMQAALQRYTRAMARHHREDEIIPRPESR